MLPAAEIFPMKRTIKEKSNIAWSRLLNFAEDASGDDSTTTWPFKKNEKIIIIKDETISCIKNWEKFEELWKLSSKFSEKIVRIQRCYSLCNRINYGKKCFCELLNTVFLLLKETIGNFLFIYWSNYFIIYICSYLCTHQYYHVLPCHN